MPRLVARLVAIALLALLGACSDSGSSQPVRDGGAGDASPADALAADADARADSAAPCTSDVAPAPGLVISDHGPIRAKDDGQVWAFLGIPFAAPPVGPLRFAPPQEPACWSAVRDADAFPPACTQMRYEQGSDAGTPSGQEDCLYLNVWVPKAASNTPRPVMVFIHGGGNTQGSTGNELLGVQLYDGAQVAERGDVVVVTVQYRLGPMGFLVLPELAAESPKGVAGNYGLRDQQLALRWVQRHAARLGGDPAKVLLFGESAGAVNTCMHLVSPLSAGLFSRALMQSGACGATVRSVREAEGAELAQQMGCDTASDRLACLRALPATQLVSLLTSPLAGGIAKMAFGPTIDGDVIPKAPMAILQAGEHNHVPFIVGSNADEMAASVPPLSISPAIVTATLGQFPAQFQDRLLALYPPGSTREEARESYVRATTDAQFSCNARRIARAARASQSEPVYRYFFTRKMPGPLADTYGAFHGLELFYVFQALERSTIAAFLDAGDEALTAQLLRYWARFATSGDPNGSDDPSWALYDGGTDAALQLDATSVMLQGVRSEACDLWDEIGTAIGAF